LNQPRVEILPGVDEHGRDAFCDVRKSSRYQNAGGLGRNEAVMTVSRLVIHRLLWQIHEGLFEVLTKPLMQGSSQVTSA
jgi:hypothetical protein